MNPAIYVVLAVIIIAVLLLRYEQQSLWVRRHTRKKRGGSAVMEELARNFLDKECVIDTFRTQLTGTLREVTAGAILLEGTNGPEAVNLEYVIRIREYPRGKNGKKKWITD